MEVLTHGDNIKLASWHYNYATVRTLKAVRPNIVPSDDSELAWTIKSATILTNDPSHADAHNEAQARAIIVAMGETVSIDGKPYLVRVPRGNESEARNSDPIHFIPVPHAI